MLDGIKLNRKLRKETSQEIDKHLKSCNNIIDLFLFLPAQPSKLRHKSLSVKLYWYVKRQNECNSIRRQLQCSNELRIRVPVHNKNVMICARCRYDTYSFQSANENATQRKSNGTGNVAGYCSVLESHCGLWYCALSCQVFKISFKGQGILIF